jgi:hypothetical protein
MAYPIIDIQNIRETQDENTRKKMARLHRREARVQRKKKTIDALYNV